MRVVIVAAVSLFAVCFPVSARGQDRLWSVEATAGGAGFVDDATKHFRVAGGSARRYVSPRVSVGPEVVVMSGDDGVTDMVVMATGNVVFDLYVDAPSAPRRFVPFLVAGAGISWGRDQVRGGPYWWREAAVTAGAGVRARMTDAISASIEYRTGWELHQRVTGSVGYRW